MRFLTFKLFKTDLFWGIHIVLPTLPCTESAKPVRFQMENSFSQDEEVEMPLVLAWVTYQ